MHCEQPACSGSIQDGYCDVCGSPSTVQAASRAPGVETPTATATVVANRSAGSATNRPTGGTTASYRLASAPIGSARSSSTIPTRRLSASARSRAPRLGAGITTVPSTPITDPRSAVMADPVVEESKRNCPSCGAEVGRRRGDKPGRTEGFCPQCRSPFSFTPKLQAGDLVGGQYEIVGCLAHGGLGWIYLGRDKNVSDRYVVLKGLLNSGDADAFQAAIAERQFLAEVEQPLIVEIYNFVSHEGAGYTVMEYVGGKSLKTLLKDRMRANNGQYDAIPVDQAIAYVIEILPAFAYLHANGLIYCDFKPDNVIQQGDGLKLIDLGGVRRIDDATSAIYGTIGFQAPEIAELGPSISSDIYTIGRTLAVLAMEFRGYQNAFVDRLPDPQDTPLFQQYDSLYRVLAKATAASPDDRFQSTDELREQLLGVLREIVAMRTLSAVSHSSPSTVFEVPTASGASLDWSELPKLRVDPADPMASWLAGISIPDPLQRAKILQSATTVTLEVQLALAYACIESHDLNAATDHVNALLTADPWEWRAVWLAGLTALQRNEFDAAIAAFNAVYGQVPGELAAKLALALACERAQQFDTAIGCYEVCVRCDANYSAPAAFGLARVHRANGALEAALSALDAVPMVNRSFVESRKLRAATLLEAGSFEGCSRAYDSIEALSIDGHERHAMEVAIYEAALARLLRDGDSPTVNIGGVPCRSVAIRRALESAYRELAAVTEDRSERIALVDRANTVRPRSLV